VNARVWQYEYFQLGYIDSFQILYHSLPQINSMLYIPATDNVEVPKIKVINENGVAPLVYLRSSPG
jgi:hypothetical protein